MSGSPLASTSQEGAAIGGDIPLHSSRGKSSSVLQYPPIHSGTSVPSGAFLNPSTRSTETGISHISRSGFPQLASSSIFIQSVEKAFDALFDDFSLAWLGIVAQTNNSSSTSFATPSPFTIFKNLYTKHGCHMWQMYWSEHLTTRLNIYQTIVRTVTGKTAGRRANSYSCLLACL
jgi:hypothetical protein